MEKMTNFLTAGQLAETLHVSLTTVRRWDKSGKLKPSMRLRDGTRLYSAKQVQDYIDAQEEKLRLQQDKLNTTGA